MRIRFGAEVCGDPGQALRREWLETNGLGGFASSTIAGVNTRRYHGLLTAATRPPVGRVVLLSKLEEVVTAGGRRVELSANQYPGAIHPQGFRLLEEFRLDPFPVFVYPQVEKRVFLVDGENTVVVEYTAREACELEVRPLVAFRDYHSLTRRNDALRPETALADGCATIQPYADLPALHFAHNGSVEPAPDWYYNFEYSAESERGLDCREDLWCPFVARFALAAGQTAVLIASLEARQAGDAALLREAELRRRAAAGAGFEDPLLARLAASADQYVVRRGELQTVIAGYHWFSDWGRDTMIALPGIALATGKFEAARRILLAFARSLDRGMLPNRFPDAGEAPEYNTVDATLWFFEAIRAYVAYTGDTEFARGLYPALVDIVEWHLRGTRYGIRVDDDGLLKAGVPGAQLTWMDVKIGDWVVTPRHGKPVEIQALWYNALRTTLEFAALFGDSRREIFLRHLSDAVRESFGLQFWNEPAGCLYDVVDGGVGDAAMRPNQIFAVSLRHGMLSAERARAVVDAVERELLTPLGLRSLAPGDPAYRPRYEGGVASRDSAYHQGTVWPWLMGPFLSAYVKTHGRTAEARGHAERWLRGLEEHLLTAGLGHISEIADGEAPHEPRGCIAQAWSVAELLRAAVEDVLEAKPGGAVPGKVKAALSAAGALAPPSCDTTRADSPGTDPSS